jgi:hydroxyacylglutathione hydrolase
MKRALKVAGIVLLTLALAVVAALVVTFSGGQAIQDGLRQDGVEVVKDGFVAAFVVDVGDHAVALVDAGNDPAGKAILAALARRSLGPDAVQAILLTHGDADHTAGVKLFPRATVMALEAEVPLIEGRALRGPFSSLRSPHDTGIRVGRVLRDGESLQIAATRLSVYAVPGHTSGSAAYLVGGVLFMGDAAEITSSGKLGAPRRLFTGNPAQSRASLIDLGRRLAPRSGEIKAIACAHSGLLVRGVQPLLDFGG